MSISEEELRRILGEDAWQLDEQLDTSPPITEEPVEEPVEEDWEWHAPLQYSLDQPFENMGRSLEIMGAKGVGKWLRDITTYPENYEEATAKFMDRQDGSFQWSYLGRSLLEQAGQLAGSLATRAGGAAVGAAVAGPVGAIYGGLTGPALFEFIQVVGPIAQERAGGPGNEISAEDWAIATTTAAAMGALNAIGVKKLGDVVDAPANVGAQVLNKIFRTVVAGGREGITEGTQSILEQTGSTILTEEGVQVDPMQAVGEGIIGFGVATPVQATAETYAGINQEAIIDEQDEQIAEEAQRRIDELGDLSELDIDELRDLITEQGHEVNILPTENRSDVRKKLEGFIRQDAMRDIIEEQQAGVLGSVIYEPKIKSEQKERFNNMSPDELTNYLDESFGSPEAYTEWASNQGVYSFDAQNDPLGDSSRMALAMSETNRIINNFKRPSKLDKKGMERYASDLVNKFTREQLIDLALKIPSLETGQEFGRPSMNKLSNQAIAEEIAQAHAIWELSQEKFRNIGDDRSIDIPVEPGDIDNPLIQRTLRQDGNARSGIINLFSRDSKKPIEIGFEREGGVTVNVGPNLGGVTYGSRLVVSKEQRDPRAQEYVDQYELANLPIVKINENIEYGHEAQIASIEMPLGTFPQMQSDGMSKAIGALNNWFRPYGQTGLDLGRRRREYIGNVRAMEKEAYNLAFTYEKAVAQAVKEGAIPDKETADRLGMAFLRKTGTHLPLDKEQRKLMTEFVLHLQGELRRETNDGARREITEHINELEWALAGKQKTEVALEQIPETMQKPLMAIRTSIDALTKRVMTEYESDIVTEEHKKTLEEGINRYVTRAFALFEPGLGWNPRFSKKWLRNKKAQQFYEQAVASVYAINKNKPNYTRGKARRYVDELLKLENFESTRDLARLPGILTTTEEKLNLESPGRILETRANIPRPLRKLMGEISEPDQVAITSLSRLAKLVEMASFYQDVRELNEGPGQMLFTPKPVGPYQYKIESDEFNPLSDMYTTKEIAEVLGIESNDPNSVRTTFSNIYDTIVLVPKSAVQMGMIVLSPATQARNFYGAGMMFVAAGYTSKDGLQEAIEIVKHDLFGHISYKDGVLTPEGKEAKRLYEKMQRLGIVNTSVTLNDAADLFAKISDGGRNTTVAQLSHNLQAIKNTAPGKVVDKTLGSTIRGAKATYAAADDLWKIAGFSADRRQLRKMLDNLVANDSRQERIDELTQALEVNRGNNFRINEIQQEIEALEQDIIDNPNQASVSDDIKLKVLQDYASTLTTKLGKNHTSNLAATLKSTTTLEDYIDQVAAYHVRMQIPNYDYVGKFAQLVRQFPLGDFIAFPTEILRNAGNIAQISAKQLSYKIPDSLMEEGNLQKQRMVYKSEDGTTAMGLPTGQRPLMANGVKKSVLGAGMIVGSGAILEAIGQLAFDVEDEELEAASEVGPEYARNSRKMPVSKVREDGTGFDFIDLTWLIPYDGLASVQKSVQNSIREGEYTGDSIPKSVVKGFVDWLDEYLTSYTGISISAKTQLEILQNQDLDTGKPIYNPEAPWGEVVTEIWNHAIDSAGPGMVSQFRDVYRAMQEGDERYDKYFNDVDWLKAQARLFGLSTSKIDPKQSLPFIVSDYKKYLEQFVEERLRRYAYTGEAISEEDILQAWSEAQDIWWRGQQQLYFQIESMRLLKLSDREIRKQLNQRFDKGTGVPSNFTSSIMKGKFTPYIPQKYIRKGFLESQRKLRKIQEEKGRDPEAITRSWPSKEIRRRENLLKNRREGGYDLKKFSSAPRPWEEED